MPVKSTPRDYSLIGLDSKLAEERGLADAQWYACPISRSRMKELMQRRDGPAIRDALLWFGLLILTGTLGYYAWGTWWAVPAFAAYGVLYAASDSRWHECGHRTAFKTRWLNDVVYEIASFMVIRESTSWRWSHTRHHTDTIIVGRDPEIPRRRPPVLPNLLLNLFDLKAGPREFYEMLIHASGRLTPDEATYVPDAERWKVYLTARVYVLIYLTAIVWAILARSFLPLMYVGLPMFYGDWLQVLFGTTQHLGLAEDVLDHRLNCRTVYMNPIFRFLYWNMNYHVEHHMFPMVPYYRLPALHAEIKDDMPPAYHGLWDAYREIIPAVRRQAKDPTFYVKRPLPTTARIVTALLAALVPSSNGPPRRGPPHE